MTVKTIKSNEFSNQNILPESVADEVHELPTEIIVQILENIPDFSTRLEFSRTCHNFQSIAIAEEKRRWENQIKLVSDYCKHHMNYESQDEQILGNSNANSAITLFQIRNSAINVITNILGKSYKECYSVYVYLNFFRPKPIELIILSCETISLILNTFIEQMSIIYPNDSANGYGITIKTLLNAGHYECLEKALELTQRYASANTDNYLRISTRFFHLGDKKSFQKAIETVSLNKDISLKKKFYKSIADNFLAINDKESIEKAAELTLSFPKSRNRDTTLIKIIESFCKFGDKESIQKAVDLIRLFKNKDQKDNSILKITSTLIALEDVESLEKAANLTHLFINTNLQDYCLRDIIKAFLKLNDKEHIDKAIDLVNFLTTNLRKNQALAKIIEVLLNDGDRKSIQKAAELSLLLLDDECSSKCTISYRIIKILVDLNDKESLQYAAKLTPSVTNSLKYSIRRLVLEALLNSDDEENKQTAEELSLSWSN